MTTVTRLVAFSLLALPTYCVQAASADEPAELFTRVAHYYVNYSIKDDRSSVETHDYAVKVLSQQALAAAKQTSISYSTSIEKAEVLSAYTLKPDGRRIDAPKSNYQVETNTGNAKDAPVFSDRTRLTVVFPEVAVGDIVGFSYRLTQTQPMFPGHFSMVQNLSRDVAYDDVKIKFDYPAAMWVQAEARQLTPVASTESGGRKVMEWSFVNKVPMKNKRRDYSVYDPEQSPGVALSTFKSYEEIAAAYGARARPKAAVTDQVKALANQIAGEQKTPRDTARALYDWVSTNITYAGNCIGTGAVVPHDIPFILENKMGDCKDHATLLQALLSAKGIDSSQALVNAGSSFKLAKVPVVSTVNHVINYLPAFDLFVDSTSNSTPFGMLPRSSQDKPVILVDGFKPGMKTPGSAVGSNSQVMTTRINIKDDGSASGSVEVTLKGEPAVSGRAALRNADKATMDDLVKNVLQHAGYTGNGKFAMDDPKPLLDTFSYKASFDFKTFTQVPGAGAFAIYPVFFNMAPVANYISSSDDDSEPPHEFGCSNGESTEEYIYTFPKKMKVLSVPQNKAVASTYLNYQASYRLKGNQLTVTRKVVDRTPGNVCGPAVAQDYKQLSQKVMPDLKAQVVYK